MGNCSSRSDEEKEKFSMSVPPLVVPSSSKHTATLIFLHGLGDTGQGWSTSLSSIRPSHVKVICPTANKMAVTLNSGFESTSWFNLLSLDADGPEDEEGIKKASEYVKSLIDEEIKLGIPPERIMIGGFSQGGSLALYVAVTCGKPLGGVIALSCWLPLHKQLDNRPTVSIPCLQAHGECDPIVPYRWGQLSASLLKKRMTDHTFKTYSRLMHSSCEPEMQDVKKFIAKCVP